MGEKRQGCSVRHHVRVDDVSVFVVILVEFYKYTIKSKYQMMVRRAGLSNLEFCLLPNWASNILCTYQDVFVFVFVFVFVSVFVFEF